MKKHSTQILVALSIALPVLLCTTSEAAAQNGNPAGPQQVAVSYYKTDGYSAKQIIRFRTWPRDRALYDEDARQVVRSLKEKAEVKQVSYDKEQQEFIVQAGSDADITALRWKFQRSKARKVNRNP